MVRALGRYSIAVHTRLALSAVMAAVLAAVAVVMELIPSARSQAWYVPGRSEMRKHPALSPRDEPDGPGQVGLSARRQVTFAAAAA